MESHSTKTTDITVYANSILSMVKACPVSCKKNDFIDTLLGSKRKTLPIILINSEHYAVHKGVARQHLQMCLKYLIDCNLVVKNKGATLQLTENGHKWLTASDPCFVITITLPAEVILPASKKKEKQPKENKVKSYIQTYKMFQFEGRSLEEIAASRDLAVSTIESHLLDCVKNGLDVDVARLGFTNDKLSFLMELISKHFAGQNYRIKPIKEECERLAGDSITYFDIKYALALMKQ